MLNKPRNTKYAKVRRGSIRRVDMFSDKLKFGSVGLVALEACFLTFNQIEACRKVISRYTRRKGKVWIRMTIDYPFTSKPNVRMGKGKGKVDLWVCRVSKGKVLFEIDGLYLNIILNALKAARKKLPLKTNIINVNK